ncbi:MAG: LmeA family phospholipid-binding protein [Egibacteraceae bacterium]
MRAFLAWVIALALLAVAVDAGLERVAERRASQQASALLDAPATVDLRGWPVSLRLLLGTLPAVDVHATNVPTDARVRVARLDARLSEVRLRLADLSTGRLPASARSGTFVADLDPAAVERLLGPVGRVSDIRLVAGAVQLRVVGIVVDAAVAVEDETLVITLVNVPRDAPREVPRRLKVPLPTLPAGATIERVIVLDGVLQLQGTFVPALLETSRRVPPPAFPATGR